MLSSILLFCYSGLRNTSLRSIIQTELVGSVYIVQEGLVFEGQKNKKQSVTALLTGRTLTEIPWSCLYFVYILSYHYSC